MFGFIGGIIAGIGISAAVTHIGNIKTLYKAVQFIDPEHALYGSLKVLFDVGMLRIEQLFRKSIVYTGKGYYEVNFYVHGHLHRIYIKPWKIPILRSLTPLERGYKVLVPQTVAEGIQ